MRTVTPKLVVITDENGDEWAAVALGRTAAESMDTLAAIKSEPLAPLGDNPKLVAPIKIKSAKTYIRRADGTVLEFSIGGPQPRHSLKTAGSQPEVL